jgi:alkylation response protein AidB-like acyl-CoA dehydrogenase
MEGLTRKDNKWLARADQVALEVLARYADDVDRQGRWPGESVAALAEAGFLGLTVPLSLGGGGEGPQTFAAVACTLARQCASTAMIYLMHVCATQVFLAAGMFAQREAVFREIAAGRHLSTLAFSEKGSRSHFWAPVSEGVLSDGRCLLSAEKSFVTSAGHADSYVVSTRSAGAAEPTRSTLYYVPPEAPGLVLGAPWNGLGLRGNASAPVRLESVAVPLSNRLSNEGEGFAVMLNTVLPWFQLGSAAVSVGIARAATEGIRRHLEGSKLEHLGQPLAALANLRARLAQMQIAVDTQQVFLEHVAERMENAGPESLLPLLESKAGAAEAALSVTELALRTGGGAAFGRHLTVERNFRDARAASIMAPTTDILYDFIGKSLLNMPLF